MKKIISSIFFIIFFVGMVSTAFAQVPAAPGMSFEKDKINLGSKQFYGIKATDPNASVGNIVSNAVKIIFFAGGLAVLVFIVWGAFDWITSEGDKEKISSARKKITNSLIGLALLALSFFIITLAGQVVGFNPLETEFLPKLDDPPRQAPRTTP